ncbi:2-amino-4-hydroxy-6-hydroxymethyldihydropteridine diphosphokinase [Photobacterium proteolyticum]|uniref:2-amino-4-hydroxy-6-hydroxymethyldihydropteridine diphosphokinase n=1 Tax=Photobacterium proteolyticum TaxID=1903952 RepID=A0A1Q9GS58_9GAMM|nr:2-amino-4-hydroxy-6-hydroxymethyldihydropteridine diphosphokinase [Photobacterium proteolyticum]OLQ77497.1 2-amino-4-hydroxy-6-hydroxymethyldihydropteridine diphosphokinase [Photobacterium proteolyticum]
MITAYISLGSNIDREYHIRAAITELKKLGTDFQVSQIFEAEPVGFCGPNFYNCVAAINTSLPLDRLQQILKQLELQYGRAPDARKNQSRTLDLDILLFGDVVQAEAPMLPRSDLYKFAFVLRPMMELCPDLVIPGDGRTIAQLWHSFEPSQALWPVERIAC